MKNWPRAGSTIFPRTNLFTLSLCTQDVPGVDLVPCTSDIGSKVVPVLCSGHVPFSLIFWGTNMFRGSGVPLHRTVSSCPTIHPATTTDRPQIAPTCKTRDDDGASTERGKLRKHQGSKTLRSSSDRTKEAAGRTPKLFRAPGHFGAAHGPGRREGVPPQPPPPGRGPKRRRSGPREVSGVGPKAFETGPVRRAGVRFQELTSADDMTGLAYTSIYTVVYPYIAPKPLG